MYQVIARKHRPQTFDEVVGQAHVKQTLRNALDQRRIAHGYIFSGPRGTGKTTMARIVAMSLNYEEGPSSEPDPESPVCREIAAGGSLDVVEIDAASNRRIDDIRELRESVKFRPARDRYKVFIIDEAHQITNDAFNALLKTLEEPPDWTVFIFCTTEPQAIPATIASRCQSFAFRSVDLPEILDHLRNICGKEGIDAEDDALLAIALAGDGSIRDSLSTLDQAIAAFGKKLEVQSVRDLLGAIPSEVTDRILGAIVDAEPATMLAVADDLFREGRHPQHFCGELIRQFRNLMVMKVAGTASKLVATTERERETAQQWLDQLSKEDLIRYVQILLALYEDLQQATQQRFRLEIGLLKLVYAGRLRPIEEVLSGLEPAGAEPPERPAGQRGPQTSGPESSRSEATASQPATPRLRSAARAPEPSPAKAGGSPEPDPAQAEGESTAPSTGDDSSAPARAADADSGDDIKGRLIASIVGADASFLADAIRMARVERRDRVVTIHVNREWIAIVELQQAVLEAALFGIVGGNAEIRLVPDDGGRSERQQSSTAATGKSGSAENGAAVDDVSVSERALADPAVREFQHRFEGRVANVMDLKEDAS